MISFGLVRLLIRVSKKLSGDTRGPSSETLFSVDRVLRTIGLATVGPRSRPTSLISRRDSKGDSLKEFWLRFLKRENTRSKISQKSHYRIR